MRRLVSLILLWLLATVLIAEARFVKTWWNQGSAAVLPFQGLGDILSNVVTYHSASSCWQNNQVSSTVALIKDLATGATSTTLGCNGPIGPGTGAPTVIGGSALTSTCASYCYVDTLYDPSAGNNCLGAPCNLNQSLSTFGANANPTFVANCAPNGTGYCLHFQGWADGSTGTSGGIAASGNSYTNGTGAVVITTTPTNYYVAGGSIKVSALTGSGASALNGTYVVTSATAHTVGFTAASGLGPGITITGGNYSPTPQTLNNNTTFSQVNEPFTVIALMTSDGYQDAGTSGGPNGNAAQADSALKVGFNTTPTGSPPPGGVPTLVMTNGNTPITACSSGCTITRSVSYGNAAWYSLLAVFNGASSWFCINGICNGGSSSPLPLGGSLNWASGSPSTNTGYSEGNGSGGWGGRWLESAMMTGDKHTLAAAVYANQKARFGNF